ncbi:MAG: hypothetical protein MZU95_04855 [Desulfomicrobium escambiense]|nr:hypothetical protein [Desulfomicrobium escambiense]
MRTVLEPVLQAAEGPDRPADARPPGRPEAGPTAAAARTFSRLWAPGRVIAAGRQDRSPSRRRGRRSSRPRGYAPRPSAALAAEAVDLGGGLRRARLQTRASSRLRTARPPGSWPRTSLLLAAT